MTYPGAQPVLRKNGIQSCWEHSIITLCNKRNGVDENCVVVGKHEKTDSACYLWLCENWLVAFRLDITPCYRVIEGSCSRAVSVICHIIQYNEILRSSYNPIENLEQHKMNACACILLKCSVLRWNLQVISLCFSTRVNLSWKSKFYFFTMSAKVHNICWKSGNLIKAVRTTTRAWWNDSDPTNRSRRWLMCFMYSWRPISNLSLPYFIFRQTCACRTHDTCWIFPKHVTIHIYSKLTICEAVRSWRQKCTGYRNYFVRARPFCDCQLHSRNRAAFHLSWTKAMDIWLAVRVGQRRYERHFVLVAAWTMGEPITIDGFRVALPGSQCVDDNRQKFFGCTFCVKQVSENTQMQTKHTNHVFRNPHVWIRPLECFNSKLRCTHYLICIQLWGSVFRRRL